MSENPFKAHRDFTDKPNRNVFDLSFTNNFTAKFGNLYPVFCKEVIPGDSFNIDPVFGLRMMPLAFPVQTTMRANLHFFYVRNRNLWKDWQDFISRTRTDLEMPYIARGKNDVSGFFNTGSLSDYLGVPSTVVGSFGQTKRIFPVKNTGYEEQPEAPHAYQYLVPLKHKDVETSLSLLDWINYHNNPEEVSRDPREVYTSLLDNVGYTDDLKDDYDAWCFRFNIDDIFRVKGDDELYHFDLDFELGYSHISEDYIRDIPFLLFYNEETKKVKALKVEYSVDRHDRWRCTYHFAVSENSLSEILSISGNKLQLFIPSWIYNSSDSPNPVSVYRVLEYSTQVYKAKDLSKMPDVINVYDGKNIRISALPYRAYESIYNAFYRDYQNDPLMINGVPEYNKLLLNYDGGADTINYTIRRRRWENDMFTTAVQTPQMGDAPLVGISGTGKLTFRDKDGVTYEVKARVSEDGNTIIGVDHQSNLPNSVLRSVVDIASSGISINDFRNVNALQRWLETNIRKGFRYKDQIEAHFGVKPSYAPYDFPEFIGGVSKPIMVNQISQTVDTANAPLGSYAGQATCIGAPNASINHYCDEHGFIIGIFSVAPVPVYSQVLPKQMFKTNAFEFFFPEFGHIGMQPIQYKELCPVQASLNAQDDEDLEQSLSDVFGYQRAWYEYMASLDEAHGDFRLSLSDFLLSRVFNSKPRLSERFLNIHSEDLNDIFTVNSKGDTILGTINFRVIAKRPIPRIGIPRLE